MSACGSNRLTTFSLAVTTSPSNTRRLVWVMTRSIKGQVMADFAAPIHDGRFSACRQHHKRSLQGQLGGPRGGKKLAIQLPLLAAAVLDGMGTLFGQPAVITPADRGAAGQRTRLFQQPRHGLQAASYLSMSKLGGRCLAAEPCQQASRGPPDPSARGMSEEGGRVVERMPDLKLPPKGNAPAHPRRSRSPAEILQGETPPAIRRGRPAYGRPQRGNPVAHLGPRRFEGPLA
jgi:hypothetical protein